MSPGASTPLAPRKAVQTRKDGTPSGLGHLLEKFLSPGVRFSGLRLQITKRSTFNTEALSRPFIQMKETQPGGRPCAQEGKGLQ